MNEIMHLNQLGKYVDSKDYNAWVYAKTIDESETKWEVFKEKHDECTRFVSIGLKITFL